MVCLILDGPNSHTIECKELIYNSAHSNSMKKNVTITAILTVASVAVLALMLQPFGGDLAVSQGAGDQNIHEDTHNDTVYVDSEWPNMHANVVTSFNAEVTHPSVEHTAFIHPFAIVIGNCHIGKWVTMSPTAVCRADEGTPILIGDGSNIQDGVVLHALETVEDGHNIDDRRFSMDGKRLKGDDPAFMNGYAVFVGNNTSLAHGSMVHGPAWVGSYTFIGMESLIFNAKVGNNVAVGVSATITGGVYIPDGKFVPPGSVIVTQEQADALPERIGSAYETINDAVVDVNLQLAEGYGQLDLERLAIEREKAMEKNMIETGMPGP